MITNFSTLFYEDSYRQDFTAELLEIAGPDLIDSTLLHPNSKAIQCESNPPEPKLLYRLKLSQSCFYPEGGGQAGDRGWLADSPEGLKTPEEAIAVVDSQESDGSVIHLCRGPVPFRVGQTLYGRIDWERRYDFMQQHSAEHILSGLICARYHCRNVGFHINEREMTLDFDAFIENEALSELELEANRVIQQNLPIEISTHEPEEIPGLVFRAKKEVPEQLRLVTIGEIDRCACCGTQLRHSGEIGVLVIVSAMRYKGGVRLSAMAGLRAVRYIQQRFHSSSAAAAALSCQAVDLDSALGKNLEKLRAQELHSARLSRLLFSSTLPDAAQLSPPDTVRFFQGFTDPQLKSYCKLMAEKLPGAHYALLEAEGKRELRYFAASENIDLRPAGREVNAALGGRGGGQAGFIQGSIPQSWDEARLYFSKICSVLPDMLC